MKLTSPDNLPRKLSIPAVLARIGFCCLVVAFVACGPARNSAAQSSDNKTAPNRPQEPKRPYPYDEIDVFYKNPRAKVTLAGTLTLPKADEPCAAVLLVLGSGRLERDEEVADHKIFLVLADYLTRRGLAVLRVDKRGLGKSTGDYSLHTSEDLADDVLAGVEYLKGRKEIDPSRIGLVGHSEGGLVAPLAASRSKDVAFVIALGGPGMIGEQVFMSQGVAIARADGEDEVALSKIRDVNLRFNAYVREGHDRAALAKKMKVLIKELPDRMRRQVEGLMEVPTSPWYRLYIDYDPAPALAAVRCPILFFVGEKDLQVLAPENLKAAEAAKRKGNNSDFTVMSLPNINHALQTCRTGAPSEYGSIEETIAPVVLDLIGDWIVKRTSRAKPKVK